MTDRSAELLTVARSIADALPTTVEEVVVTGSLSRGVADEVSDIERPPVPRSLSPQAAADAQAPGRPRREPADQA